MIREDLAHLYNYFSLIYIQWYCRCRHGVTTFWTPDDPDVATVSHGITPDSRSVKDMPRCRPGLVPVYHGSPRCGHGSPRCGHGCPRFSLGLSRSFGTVFGFNVLCFPSWARRCNSNWLVSKCAWNKMNICDHLKLCTCQFCLYCCVICGIQRNGKHCRLNCIDSWSASCVMIAVSVDWEIICEVIWKRWSNEIFN